MFPRRFLSCIALASALAASTEVWARQGPPAEEAGGTGPMMAPTPSSAAAAPSLLPITAPSAPAAPSASNTPADRPVRGPAMRERGGRRSRGASTASGALMLTIIVAALGYYVVKRLRR